MFTSKEKESRTIWRNILVLLCTAALYCFVSLQCFIHGEACNVTGLTSEDNDCCGDVKYYCEVVSESLNDDDTRCCMEVGTSGCSFDYHCCGEDIGNHCLDSRCVWANDTYPGDSSGTRDVSDKSYLFDFCVYCGSTLANSLQLICFVFLLQCGLKGDICTVPGDCCGGETKYKCLDTGLGNTTCCLKSSLNGCSQNEHCCDGYCDVVLALCCIPNGNTCNNTLSYECCSGYCNNATHVCDTLVPPSP